MSELYGIAEWFGQPLLSVEPDLRSEFAHHAQNKVSDRTPVCPFQPDQPPCSKKGGVCSIQRYTRTDHGHIGVPVDDPVITCPRRFEQESLIVRWLAEIAEFPATEISVAREIPFMVRRDNQKPAGKIDRVVAHEGNGRLDWHGLEIQAVYFSGPAMASEFTALQNTTSDRPPYPTGRRRPDWRSSSAKRLMPQLRVEVPTLRQWGKKMAVAVDKPFFASIGGPSSTPHQDINDGDIIWLVTRLEHGPSGGLRLRRHHWEVLTLEASEDKLLAADPVTRQSFETVLRDRLEPLEG